MSTFVAEHQTTELNNIWMSGKTGLFKLVQILLTSFTLDEHQVWYPVPINRATLPRSEELVERQDKYTPNKSFDKQENKIEARKEKTPAKAFSEDPREYEADHIVRHVGEGDKVQ